MSFALGEVTALARKAARGAGMEWGLAEEAGAATRYLCAHGLPGVEALAQALTAQDGADWADLCPDLKTDAETRMWSSRSGAMCPIAAGVTLTDRAGLQPIQAAFRLTGCNAPVLLLRFVSVLAQRQAKTVAMDAGDFHAVFNEDGPYFEGPAPIDPCDVHLTALSQHECKTVDAVRPVHRANPEPGAIARLEDFAGRLYAPETETRRQKGAGASDSGGSFQA